MIHDQNMPRRGMVISPHMWAFGTLLVWCIGVLVLAALGIVAYLPTQLLPMPVVIGTATPIVLYACSPRLRGYMNTVDLRWLTLFNIWRVPAALAFFRYGTHGLLPQTFVFNAVCLASPTLWPQLARV